MGLGAEMVEVKIERLRMTEISTPWTSTILHPQLYDEDDPFIVQPSPKREAFDTSPAQVEADVPEIPPDVPPELTTP